MRFNLEALNPGTWYFFEEGDEDKGSVCLRICDVDYLKDIRKKTIRKRVVYKDHVRHEYEEEDEDIRNELLWNYCIVDWKGLVDQDNNLIPCDKEMKLLLMGKSVSFATFVNDKLKELSDLESNRQEEVEKN